MQHCVAARDDGHGVALFAVIRDGAEDQVFGGIIGRGGFVEYPDVFFVVVVLFVVDF